MQSKKRFTEINIWEADWYMFLTPTQKLMLKYITDRCDNIGVWDTNLKLAAFHVGISGDPVSFWDDFVMAVNNSEERIIQLDSGAWFIVGFVEFQYCKGNKPLSNKSPAHKSYIGIMHERGLWEWFCENQAEIMPQEEVDMYMSIYPKPTLSVGYQNGSDRAKDKEEEKEADKVEDINKDKDSPEQLHNEEDPLSFEKDSMESQKKAYDKNKIK
ncbi:MAG: hypothetical protein WEA58_04675 [Balneolaceae bacterium]